MSELDTTLLDYDGYITRLFAAEDETLRQTREAMAREGLPQINVSASEGQLLHVLAAAIGARRILEIGALGGYSAIWLARALPADGKLISLEIDPHHADVARQNIQRAGLDGRVDVRVGPAADLLDAMTAAGEPAFDLAFIDADKDGYPMYLEKALGLVREGGLILADNALPRNVLQPDQSSGVHRYNIQAASDNNLTSVVLPVLRGHIDGLAISVKRMRS